MKTQKYVAVSRKGRVRLTQQKPTLQNDELAFRLNINIPDSAFTNLLPVVSVNLDEKNLIPPVVDVSVEVVK